MARRGSPFMPKNKKDSVLPTHPSPQTHHTPEGRQSSAASMSIADSHSREKPDLTTVLQRGSRQLAHWVSVHWCDLRRTVY